MKIVEGMDLITYFLRTTIEDSYLGQYPNTYDNKQLLVAYILEYLHYLERAEVLSPGESFCEIDYDRQLNYLKSQGVEVADLTRPAGAGVSDRLLGVPAVRRVAGGRHGGLRGAVQRPEPAGRGVRGKER